MQGSPLDRIKDELSYYKGEAYINTFKSMGVMLAPAIPFSAPEHFCNGLTTKLDNGSTFRQVRGIIASQGSKASMRGWPWHAAATTVRIVAYRSWMLSHVADYAKDKLPDNLVARHNWMSKAVATGTMVAGDLLYHPVEGVIRRFQLGKPPSQMSVSNLMKGIRPAAIRSPLVWWGFFDAYDRFDRMVEKHNLQPTLMQEFFGKTFLTSTEITALIALPDFFKNRGQVREVGNKSGFSLSGWWSRITQSSASELAGEARSAIVHVARGRAPAWMAMSLLCASSVITRMTKERRTRDERPSEPSRRPRKCKRDNSVDELAEGLSKLSVAGAGKSQPKSTKWQNQGKQPQIRDDWVRRMTSGAFSPDFRIYCRF